MEAIEMPEFAHKMSEAHPKEPLRNISLAISVLAVLAALISVLGHRSHTHAIMVQAHATDLWNSYEAQNIRSQNLELSLDMLALQPILNSNAVEAKIAQYRNQLVEWEHKLADQKTEAERQEHDVERAESRALRFDLGDALLQIAVVVSSITLLTRRHSYFLGGIALGAIGVLVAASAWLIH